jgi:pimeloyl-ACP methyl ester carboxylesterase
MIKGLRPRIQESEKKPGEWNEFHPTFSPHLSVPYVFIKGCAGRDDSRGDGKNDSNSEEKYLIICHGAAHGNEYCYKEWREISKDYNISIICVEYPGFGGRKNELGSEDVLYISYPNEVIDLVENHLHLDWSKIYILGQCLGAPIAIRLATSYPYIASNIRGLYLTKPFSSLHNTFQSLPPTISDFMRSNVPDLYTTQEKWLKKIVAPVTCIQGEDDSMCKVEMTKNSLLRLMTNSPKINFYTLPHHGHTVLMKFMLAYVKKKYNVQHFS